MAHQNTSKSRFVGIVNSLILDLVAHLVYKVVFSG